MLRIGTAFVLPKVGDACAVAATLAPAAAADSLVFIRGHNVWLANPDGSGQYQVTFDCESGSP